MYEGLLIRCGPRTFGRAGVAGEIALLAIDLSLVAWCTCRPTHPYMLSTRYPAAPSLAWRRTLNGIICRIILFYVERCHVLHWFYILLLFACSAPSPLLDLMIEAMFPCSFRVKCNCVWGHGKGSSFVLLFKEYAKGNDFIFHPLIAVKFIIYLAYFSVWTYCEVHRRAENSVNTKRILWGQSIQWDQYTYILY